MQSVILDPGVENAGEDSIGRHDNTGIKLWSREQCYIRGKIPELDECWLVT